MNGTAISVTPTPVPLPPLFNPNVKDSRWLTLEVCREYTRNKCTRTDHECKFAHPPPHVEVQNGRVTCCFDSIKGKCQRKDPPCKYLHPPQHLKEQLLQNGRNNLILRNLQWQALTTGLQPVVPQALPTVVYDTASTNGKAAGYPSPMLQAQYPSANFIGPPGYIVSNPAAAAAAVNAGINPYMSNQAGLTNVIQNIDGLGMTSLPVSSLSSGSSTQVPNAMVTGATPTSMAQKVARADRLEVCREFQRGTCSRQPNECRYAHPPDTVTIDTTDNHVTVCMDFLKGKCSRDSCRYFHPPPHLQGQLKAAQQRANAAATAAAAQSQSLSMNPVPGMVPIVKRTAMDGKAGVAMYPSAGPATATYQQALAAMQIQQQPYVPVTIAGHPPGVPRF